MQCITTWRWSRIVPHNGRWRRTSSNIYFLNTNSSWENYIQSQKEPLAVVYAVGKFHYNLYGRHFMIQSVHQPLSYLFSNSKAILPTAFSRIKRWSLTLSAYSYTIMHKPGKNLRNADALSWLPQQVTIESDCLPGDLIHLVNHLSVTTITAARIRQWTDRDPVLSKVHH